MNASLDTENRIHLAGHDTAFSGAIYWGRFPVQITGATMIFLKSSLVRKPMLHVLGAEPFAPSTIGDSTVRFEDTRRNSEDQSGRERYVLIKREKSADFWHSRSGCSFIQFHVHM